MEVDKNLKQRFSVKLELVCTAEWYVSREQWRCYCPDLNIVTYDEDYAQAANDMRDEIADKIVEVRDYE